MNVFENCLFESLEPDYLLPLHFLLLPLNKNCFSNFVGFCVYIINSIIHGCLEIWNFSSRVQRNSISLRAHVLLSTSCDERSGCGVFVIVVFLGIGVGVCMWLTA